MVCARRELPDVREIEVLRDEKTARFLRGLPYRRVRASLQVLIFDRVYVVATRSQGLRKTGRKVLVELDPHAT